jgi:hypothetical protein
VSSRKPPSNSGDWDDFDIPTWDEPVPSSRTRGTSPSQSSRPSSGDRQAYPDPLYDDYETPTGVPQQQARPGTGNQAPTRLSSRVPSRSTRPSQDPYSDPYSGYDDSLAGDPFYPEPQYPAQDVSRATAPSQYDLYADPALDAGWDEPAVYGEVAAPKRGRTSRQRTRASRPSVSIPRPAISDSALAAIVGAAALGLLLMIGVVWWGIGDLSDVIPWHLNASGDVDVWASNSALWRVPFGVFMSLVIGLVLGAFLWKRDRFAARFIVTSLCLVQVLAWVAVVDQLW